MSETQTRPAPRPWWLARATDTALPLWLRIASYAEAHADLGGHCPLEQEQLHQALDPYASRPTLSHAIARAVMLEWLHPSSSARCLVLARALPDHPCRATHRGQR